MKLAIVAVYLIIVFQGINTASVAQEEQEDVIIMSVDNDGLRFYAVDVSGPVELSKSPFEVDMVEGGFINSPDDIEVSPDGRYIAFSAKHQRDEYELFVFHTTGELIYSLPVEARMVLRWRPDNGGFAFMPTAHHNGDSPDDYSLRYYDLATNTISLLYPAENYIHRVMWLTPDKLIFQQSSGLSRKLILIEQDADPKTLFTAQRTNSESEIDLPYIYDTICERAWLPANEQIIISVGCIFIESIVPEALYQVTLDGQESLLLSAPFDFTQDNVFQARFSIHGIAVYQDEIYVVQSSYLRLDSDQIEPDYPWRILHLRGGSWTEIYQSELEGDYVYDVNSSPDGRYLAVQHHSSSERGVHQLTVIDLETGNRVREIEVDGSFRGSIRWLNHYTFVYVNSYDRDACNCVYAPVGSQVLIVDLSRFAIIDQSDAFTGAVWLFDDP